MYILAIIITCVYTLAAALNFFKTCTSKTWNEGFTGLLAIIVQIATIFLIWNFT